MDNRKLRGKPDRSRMGLDQDHEREYAVICLDNVIMSLDSASGQLKRLQERLRAGFPATRRGARKAKP